MGAIPESKLVSPLAKLENLVYEKDSEIVNDSEFPAIFYKAAKNFEDMLKPNEQDNIDQGKYLYDNDKFFEFLDELEKL